MKRRYLLGSGILALLVLLGLIMWQVSFDFGEYAPADLSQTFLFWAVSTLVFLLTVTLGFILFRTGLRLFVDRRSDREGSRIKSRLFWGAFLLSFLPVCFLVVFSYALLNRNLEKWFSRPGEKLRFDYISLANAMEEESQGRLRALGELLSGSAEFAAVLSGGGDPDFLAEFARRHNLVAIEAREAPRGRILAAWGEAGALERPRQHAVVSRLGVTLPDGRTVSLALGALRPLDLAAAGQRIARYVAEIDRLDAEKKSLRWFYILMQALIALFVLFLSTWIALFLARQISTPISALLKAADQVGEGNFQYRVEVSAIDELGRLVRAFNAMTAQLEANARELDARRRFTEAILESIPTGVISLTRDGVIQRVNRALKQLFPEEQVRRARRLEDLFSREDTAELRYLMKRARRTGAAARELSLNNGRQTLHLSATVAALDERQSSGFVLVLEDLSDLLRAQKAAAWHEVARRVAHEIKNPLTPIALSAERLSRQAERLAARPDAPRALEDMCRIARECAALIAAEVDSVKTLVNEFSQFTRFPAANPVRAGLNEVVESALAVFEGRLEGIRIHTHLAAGLPPVLLDREQFKRAVVNLIDNAAEAMQESLVKELSVITHAETSGVVTLVVADTGCGISPEDKEKLFLPYFSTKGRGTGVGLAIVNHILSEHGATIRVEDNRPVGAVFTVEIPALIDSDIPEAAEVAGGATGKPA
jgi:PAS domain S-box-containing protein